MGGFDWVVWFENKKARRNAELFDFGFVGNDGVSQGLSSNPYATWSTGIARGQMEDSAMPANHYTANHPAILCRSH